MKTSTRCWCCGCIITRGTSLPSIDPSIRVCWSCDGQVKRKSVASMTGMKGMFAAFADPEPLNKQTQEV